MWSGQISTPDQCQGTNGSIGPTGKANQMTKLVQGDKLPAITFDLIDGGTLTLPDEMPGRYVALLFYRGNW